MKCRNCGAEIKPYNHFAMYDLVLRYDTDGHNLPQEKLRESYSCSECGEFWNVSAKDLKK